MLRTILPSGLFALAAFVVFAVLLIARSTMFVDGSSMLPSLHPGQLVVVNRFGGPRREDVIVFRHASSGHDAYLIKRVIGMPGDLVLVDAGRVQINGTRLDEPYVVATDDYTYPLDGAPLRVPDGAYFVLGDNRPQSADSHLGWFVGSDDIVGQAVPLPLYVPPVRGSAAP